MKGRWVWRLRSAINMWQSGLLFLASKTLFETRVEEVNMVRWFALKNMFRS